MTTRRRPSHETRAQEAEHLGLAAEELVAAAERRAEAGTLRGEAEQADESAAERQRVEEDRRRAQERERRMAERAARRRREQRSGVRRFRPGPGSMMASPGLSLMPDRDRADVDLDREIETIARAVDEHGPTRRDELAQLVGARYWGPGRFSTALREAVSEGRVRRLSRSTVGPPEDGDGR